LANFCKKNKIGKCNFDQYKGFFMGKNNPNSPNFRKKKIQVAIFLQYVPVATQEYRRILVLFYFHI
jgi:hypothetical protein